MRHAYSFDVVQAEDWLSRLASASDSWITVLEQDDASTLARIGGIPFDMIRGVVDGKEVVVGNVSLQIVENPKSKPVLDGSIPEPSSLLPKDMTLENVTWRVGKLFRPVYSFRLRCICLTCLLYTGYFLDPQFSGKGTMTACLQRILLFLLELTSRATSSPHLPNVLASTWDTNPASGRILEKCGFRVVHHGTASKGSDHDIAFTRYQWFGLPVQESQKA